MKPTAIITGASSGIGKAFANKLSATHNIILISRREDALIKVSESIAASGAGNKAEIIVADLSREEDLKRVEQSIAGLNVNILVNAAGFGGSALFHEASVDRINEMVQLHVVCATRLTRAVLPGMIARNNGTVINVASVSGFSKVNAGNLIYDSTKTYLIRFSELLQQSIPANTNVKIQALCPGFTKTDFFSDHQHKSPIPRFLWMKAEEVVKRSLKGLKSHRTILIPGWYNALIARIIGNSFFLPVLKMINTRK